MNMMYIYGYLLFPYSKYDCVIVDEKYDKVWQEGYHPSALNNKLKVLHMSYLT